MINTTGEGIKLDEKKSPVFRGSLAYFPKALLAVSEVSAFGATKYGWGNWREVHQGFERYSDALVRHLLEEAKGNGMDAESGLLHAAHTAWNALSRLEFLLEKEENDLRVNAEES